MIVPPGISNEYVITKKTLSDYKKQFPDFDLDKHISPAVNLLEVKLDSASAIKDSLIKQVVAEENIESSKYSTDKNNDIFPSDRIEGREKRDNYGFAIALK